MVKIGNKTYTSRVLAMIQRWDDRDCIWVNVFSYVKEDCHMEFDCEFSVPHKYPGYRINYRPIIDED